jgi:hypothetical protein
MNFRRPEDEYKTPKAPEMIKELNAKPKCTYSTVMAYRHLDFGGHDHAGTLSHRCKLDKGHEGNCECVCMMQFKGF